MEAIQAQEKAKNYAKLVKEMHWPKVSDIKKQEIETIRQSLQTKYSRKDSLKLKNKSMEVGTPHNRSYLNFKNKMHADEVDSR